jgi:SAM-dependent methyltransferase
MKDSSEPFNGIVNLWDAKMSETIAACRACGITELIPILSLGCTPLANALLSADQLTQPEPSFPLDLVLCTSCSLVQITETVPSEQLFGEYLYFSSFSDTMLRHACTLVERVVVERGLGSTNRVVEIASNDGYLLQYYQRAGVQVLGVEPARNIARVAQEKGIPTVCEFFGADVAARLAKDGMRADVIHAHNVLAHVPDLNGMVKGIATLLATGGVAIVEAPYVRELIDRTEFDTIYHEHLCYFSLTAVDFLFRRHGLSIVDVEIVSIHGGTLRVFATGTAEKLAVSEAVKTLLAEEDSWGINQPASYREFSDNVRGIRSELRSMLAGLKREGHTVAAYGASAKGSTLLNYSGIGAETLDFVADRSTVKQGRFTPGTHLPIYSAERLLEEMPDYVLLLTWNFVEEILEQQAEYRARGGKFVVPIPVVRVL